MAEAAVAAMAPFAGMEATALTAALALIATTVAIVVFAGKAATTEKAAIPAIAGIFAIAATVVI